MYKRQESDVTADDLLSGTAKGTKKQAAMDFLEKLLADGQMPQTEIMELAEKKGIAEKTLRNAKEALNVKSKRLNNQWYWSLDYSKMARCPFLSNRASCHLERI